MKGLFFTWSLWALAALAALVGIRETAVAAGTCGSPGVSPVQAKADPVIIHVGSVDRSGHSTMISITIRTGTITYGQEETYVRSDCDTSYTDVFGEWIRRTDPLPAGDRYIGVLRTDGVLFTVDTVKKATLDTTNAMKPLSYVVTDVGTGVSSTPTVIYRKSRPVDLGRTGKLLDIPPDQYVIDPVMEHTLYLTLPSLIEGHSYTITFPRSEGPGTWLSGTTFTYNPRSMRSDAVHVSHLGFRPDDPAKVAFLSLWMGDGGAKDFETGKRFFVCIDDGSDCESGSAVFEGSVDLYRHDKNAVDDTISNVNNSLTDVYLLDFTDAVFGTTGKYRVCVEEVGCSYGFDVGYGVWSNAFLKAVRGIYTQRSGIAIGANSNPAVNDTFERPQDFHPPADGVYASNAMLMEMKNGLGLTEKGYAWLEHEATDQKVADAWGGYHDAGDWDRRIQHLDVARYLLDLYDAPGSESFTPLRYGNEPAAGDLPDILKEALWGVDFFKRLQMNSGAVRGGIESANIPKYGERSFQESRKVMAFAPDRWSTYLYAGVAARASVVLKGVNQDLSTQYRVSAEKAWAWAEAQETISAEQARWAGVVGSSYPSGKVSDARNLAAAELFRATGLASYHTIFLSTSYFNNNGGGACNDGSTFLWTYGDWGQAEAAWVYYRTPAARGTAVWNKCRMAILCSAELFKEAQDIQGFRIMKNPWQPPMAGAFTVSKYIPHAVRAAMIYSIENNSGDSRRLMKALILAAQTGSGANPLNISYTTGTGGAGQYTAVANVFHPNSRLSRKNPPPGLTVQGPIDGETWRTTLNGSCCQFAGDGSCSKMCGDMMWDEQYMPLFGRYLFPEPIGYNTPWPVLESFGDAYWHTGISEASLPDSMAPNAYLWGYLSKARRGAVISLYAFFASDGLYKYDTAMARITKPLPQNAVVSGSVLYSFFTSDGLYKYDGSWARLTSTQPQSITASSTGFYAYFTGDGLYKYDGAWTKITSTQPQNMIVSGSVLYACLSSGGLYKYDGSWARLTPAQPQSITASSTGFYAYFTGDGLYKYDGAWTKLTPGQPVSMVVSGSHLYAYFSSDGLYKYDGTWTKLASGQPQNIVGGGAGFYACTGFYAYFTNDGLYKYDDTWTRITRTQPATMAVSGSTLYAYFTNDGLYKFDTLWTRLTTGQPQTMLPAQTN